MTPFLNYFFFLFSPLCTAVTLKVAGTYSHKVMDKLCGITTRRNRCRVSSTRITGHQCDPSVVAAAWSVCGWCKSPVVCPFPFLLSVSPSSCCCRGGEPGKGQQVPLVPSVLRNEDRRLSPPMISQNLSEVGMDKHSQNYSFTSFLLIMQMFRGRRGDCIAADFCALSVPLGSVHSS